VLSLTPEVFQSLLALGWIDGALDPAEAEAVLRAAEDAGLAPAELDRLRAMSAKPVDFAELPTRDLSIEQRLYVYAVASWVARADDTVTTAEQAGLHAVATLLGVSGQGRRTLDALIDELRAAGHDRLDLVGLRARIDQAIREAVNRRG
jgi:uncharacterized tellurite resistance protein B-like protein